MDRNNSASARCKHATQLLPIHGVCLWIDINKDGSGSHQGYRLHCRNKGMCDGNHFIPISNITHPQCQFERICACSYPHSITTVAIGRKISLECLGLWAKK